VRPDFCKRLGFPILFVICSPGFALLRHDPNERLRSLGKIDLESSTSADCLVPTDVGRKEKGNGRLRWPEKAAKSERCARFFSSTSVIIAASNMPN